MSAIIENNWEQWDELYVWHPYTQMALVPKALGVESTFGSYLTLTDGRKIFDGISSWWVTLHGHSHPYIAKAISEQASKLEQVIFAGFTHKPASELAKRLIEKAPSGLEKVFYSDNGSTAVEVALKLCLQYWQLQKEARTTFLALSHSYHGDTFGAMSASSRGTFTDPFESLLFNVIHLPFPTPPSDYRKEFSDEEIVFLETLTKHCSTNKAIAGFIFEPLLLGAGGMRVWRSKVLQKAIEIARSHQVLTIADEVLTGFGRTGTFFATDTISLSPDLMCLSKGLSGGFMPLGVTLCTKEIFDTFLSQDRKTTFFHGHSYTGNPISCAAGVASLAIFDSEPVFDRIEKIKNVHTERMPILAKEHQSFCRIIGTMAAMEPHSSEGYLSSRSLEIGKKCLVEGLLLRPLGDTIYFLPPYSTTPDDLHRAYDILTQVLKKSN